MRHRFLPIVIVGFTLSMGFSVFAQSTGAGAEEGSSQPATAEQTGSGDSTEAEAIGSPEAEAGESGEPESGELGEAEAGESEEIEAGTSSEVEAGESGEPESGELGEVEAGESGEPESGELGEAEAGESGEPESGELGEVEAGESGEEQAMESAQAETGEPAGAEGGESSGESIESRPEVYDFEIENLDGDRVRLSDHAGEVVMVSFWATWCAPCQQELPFLQDFSDRYRDQGFTVLAIAQDGPETLSRVRSIVRRNRWTMPILLDLDGSVGSVINPRGAAPYTLFIDRHRRLAWEHEGYSSGDEVEYEAMIQRLLTEAAD